MGSCIICGTSTEGQICQTHEEDVVFEFEGTKPDQLTPGRFYHGTVDGMAEFGVFVNIGSRVTGLLHKSELDKRLESLDWDRGDDVYVQVKSIRDNGNIDLAWSIRQSEREFRGAMIDDPGRDGPYVKESEDESGNGADASADDRSADGGSKRASRSKPEHTGHDESPVQTQKRAETEREPEPVERVEVESLSERVGERVRLEGTVVGIRQTGGPTVFEVRDETAAVSCAAFEEAGVRAYPDVEVDDVVALEGTVEMHRNELQVETDSLDLLEGEDRETVEQRLADAVTAKARPDDVDLLADHPGVGTIHDDVRDAAEVIRRAVIEARPVIVRHEATADGYLAGAAIERAVLPLVREEHAQSDAEYHYFDRRPLQDRFYDMDAATGDVTDMLDNRERHDEKLPLFVLVNAGSTEESRDGLELLDIYGAKRVAIDTDYPDDEMADLLDAHVNPFTGDADEAESVTVGALGGNVAVHVNPDVRDDLAHLPAASFWGETPREYADLADAAGFDGTDTDEIREAIALVAHYQSYEDKREIITDLLWDDGSRSLAAYVSEQFRDKLETEIDTAEPNIERREVDGVSVTILDTDAFTHRFDFPPSALLVEEIHRRDSAEVDGVHASDASGGSSDERSESDGVHVTLGATDDELLVRSTDSIDVRDLAATAKETVSDAGITAKGARDGSIEFLVGERDAVIDAVIDAVADA